MENIHVTISKDGKKATLKPFEGYMLQRGVNSQLYSQATVKNVPKEMKLWKAVAV